LEVTDDAKKFLEDKKINLIYYPTPEILQVYNDLTVKEKQIGGIIHVTC